MRPLSLLIDFFDMDIDKPTDSAFNQQRAKLKPEALETVFQKFNESVDSLDASPEYRFLAADGSTATFLANPGFLRMSILWNRAIPRKDFTAFHSKGLVGDLISQIRRLLTLTRT